jgi:hypothetical protein
MEWTGRNNQFRHELKTASQRTDMIGLSPKNWRSGVVLGLSILAALIIITGCKPKAAAPIPSPVQKEPPKIVSTAPANQSSEVDPSIDEITVTFDHDMEEGMSWTGGPPDFPASSEGSKAHWLEDKRTCVLPVKLEPGRHYRVGINSPNHQNFRSLEGLPAVSSEIVFDTKGTAPTGAPRIVSTSPPNHGNDIDPAISEIRVTFDRDMEGGFSWVGGGALYPKSPAGARAYWRDKRTCVLPVTLEVGHSYRLGINSMTYQNFRSENGTPATPSDFTFKTRGAGPKAAAPSMASLQEAFDKLWGSFDRDYALFVLRPDVDWNASRSQFRSLALTARSTDEFAEVCAEMLRPLRDLHIWLTVSGESVPVFNRPRAANANPRAHEHILGQLNNPGQPVQWAITANGIGFLAIYGWSDRGIPGQCDGVLEKMRDTRALIVDVRLNGGGSEDLAREVAGRFIDKAFVYGYDQHRSGPNHKDLSGKDGRVVEPRGPWRYDRPVILLIGQKCMSSNESFVAMMSGDPNLITMGDHTCGSSGNPEMIQLPLDMTVSVPQWIDYLPDGSPLDERGFQPKVPFAPKPGAFEGERDDLLTAALERLGR